MDSDEEIDELDKIKAIHEMEGKSNASRMSMLIVLNFSPPLLLCALLPHFTCLSLSVCLHVLHIVICLFFYLLFALSLSLLAY